MTGTAADLSAAQRRAASAITQRASRILLARQDSAGRWTGRSVGDVTLEAEAVLVREILGVARPEVTRAAAQQIRSMQQPDGNWIGGAEPGRSGDLAASVIAYLALRIAGDSPDAYHLAVAAAWIRDAGGLATAGLVCTGWLAAFGLTGWDEVCVPVPELVYLPARYVTGDGDWTGLSRQAVVSLTVLETLRPVRQLPVDLSELRPGGLACASRPAGRRAPVSAPRRAALRMCGLWLVSWQQRPGLPMGNRPYCALSLVALGALGYPLRHPVVAGGLSWLDSVTARPRHPAMPSGASPMPSGASPGPSGASPGPSGAPAVADPASAQAGPVSPTSGPPGATAGQALGAASGEVSAWASGAGGAAGQGRIAAMRQPPVRDTSLSVVALADAGMPPDHPAMIAAGSWLLAQRITGPPEMAVPHLGAALSGWSFGRDGYPIAADTAEVLIALSRIELGGMAGESAVTAAIRWLNRTQRRDGSWGGSAGSTALVVQALATHSPPGARALRHGVVWLIRAQLADGSWPGRHGTAELQATTDVLAALLVAGVVPAKLVVRSAVDWLLSRQNADGGWPSGAAVPAEDDREVASQPPPASRGPQSGSDSQSGSGSHSDSQSGQGSQSDAAGTARAVAALLAAGCLAKPGAAANTSAAANTGAAVANTGAAAAVDAGAGWLMRAQRADGGWSDRPDAATRPAGRNSGRRRGSLLPGILLPLAALGQYAAWPGAAGFPGTAGSPGAAGSADAGAGVSAVGAESARAAANAGAAGSADVSSVSLGASASVR